MLTTPSSPLNAVLLNTALLNSLLVSGLLLSFGAMASTPLPKLNLEQQITLSGVSSGGYMAGQYHQAFAEDVKGVAMLAAGPVYCAQNDIGRAVTDCMANEQAAPDLAELEKALTALREQGLLAPLAAVSNSRVWLFSGTADKTVLPKVSAALASQYANWLAPAQLRVINDQPFAHHFPTDLPNLAPCDKSESPFLASCNYDTAGNLLSHLLAKTLTRTEQPSGKLYKLHQQQLAPASEGQLAEFGYAYIPATCEQGSTCQLHVSFHGCRQDASQIGEDYVTKTGLNAYADINQLVILYPQVEKSALNPFGCWDWWGYSGANYLSKEGPQLNAVKQLVDALR